jgi:hypothetical protein
VEKSNGIAKEEKRKEKKREKKKKGESREREKIKMKRESTSPCRVGLHQGVSQTCKPEKSQRGKEGREKLWFWQNSSQKNNSNGQKHHCWFV